MKKTLRETQTLLASKRTLAVVRFGHHPPARPPVRPPAVTNSQTGPITIHCAAAVADLGGGAGVGHGPPPLAHPQKFS